MKDISPVALIPVGIFSFLGGAAEGDGGAIFPIRGGVAFVTVEFAKVANLRHHIRAVLILPLVVASAG